MPILTLEPDEVLPTTPAPLEGEASGPFPIFWRGKERQFLFRAVQINRKKHVVFAREVEGAVGNWLLYERETLMPVIWSAQHPHRKLENITLEFAEQNRDLGRFFTLSNIKQNQFFRVLLIGRSAGAWLDVDVRFRTRATFDFNFPPPVFDGDRDHTRRFWQREMADFDSAIGFSARFASLHPDDRGDLIFGEHRLELAQVMKWVVRCEPLLWKCGSEWDWSLGPNTADFSYLFCPYVDNFENFEVNLPFIYAMGRFLSEDYIPKITKSLREKHRCVRDFLEYEPVWIDDFSETPTAHERLEAARQLREWLHKNDAPAELLAFLAT